MTALFSVDMTVLLFGMTALFSIDIIVETKISNNCAVLPINGNKNAKQTRCHVEQSETPDGPYLHSISTLGEIYPGYEGMLRKK